MNTGYEKTIQKYGLQSPDTDYTVLKNNDKTRWVDEDGYQYYLSKSNLSSTYAKCGNLSRFFNGNIYTECNVRLYVDRVSFGDIRVVEFNAKTAHDKIVFYSYKHGYEYSKSFNAFTRIPYLEKRKIDYVNKRRHTLEYIISNALDKFNITIISDEYLNNEEPIMFVCNREGHHNIVQSASWGQMITKKCPCVLCSKEKTEKNSKRLAKDKFNNSLFISGNKNPTVDVLGEYVSAHAKIKCKCNSCGRTIYLRPDHILNGIGCGKCTKSLGEKLIEYYFREKKIEFITQHTFKDCKIKRLLPFDFYLPNHKTAIEFDGIQHFHPSDLFGGETEFNKLKTRDEIKNRYCADHGIKLIRISYLETSYISKILDSFLSVA